MGASKVFKSQIFKHFVPDKKMIAFSKISFCAGTKVFEEELNAVKFLGWLKKFGLAQNILEPVKGQGKNRHFRPSRFPVDSQIIRH
jgi:hypothetical protein